MRTLPEAFTRIVLLSAPIPGKTPDAMNKAGQESRTPPRRNPAGSSLASGTQPSALNSQLTLPLNRVSKLHHVIKIPRFVVAAELENVHQSLVRAGDRLELLQPFELAVELLCLLEGLAMDDLDRAQRAQERPGEPDFAVAARADAAEQFVVGNADGLRVERGWS